MLELKCTYELCDRSIYIRISDFHMFSPCSLQNSHMYACCLVGSNRKEETHFILIVKDKMQFMCACACMHTLITLHMETDGRNYHKMVVKKERKRQREWLVKAWMLLGTTMQGEDKCPSHAHLQLHSSHAHRELFSGQSCFCQTIQNSETQGLVLHN